MISLARTVGAMTPATARAGLLARESKRERETERSKRCHAEIPIGVHTTEVDPPSLFLFLFATYARASHFAGTDDPRHLQNFEHEHLRAHRRNAKPRHARLALAPACLHFARAFDVWIFFIRCFCNARLREARTCTRKR